MKISWKDAVSQFKIQKIYENASFENCTEIPKKIVEIGKKWISTKKKPSLYISGPCGSGKTFFMTALLRSLIEIEGYGRMIYKRCYSLDSELLNAFNEGNEEYILKKYSEVEFLFLDDFGVERQSERVNRQFYVILDERVGNRLPTVITTNFSIEITREKFNEKIESRIKSFFEICFPNEDLRESTTFDFLDE